ncbi:hypothetical protein BC567DRAFT_78036 [Phyllosticta citribraziliensis]
MYCVCGLGSLGRNCEPTCEPTIDMPDKLRVKLYARFSRVSTGGGHPSVHSSKQHSIQTYLPGGSTKQYQASASPPYRRRTSKSHRPPSISALHHGRTNKARGTGPTCGPPSCHRDQGNPRQRGPPDPWARIRSDGKPTKSLFTSDPPAGASSARGRVGTPWPASQPASE